MVLGPTEDGIRSTGGDDSKAARETQYAELLRKQNVAQEKLKQVISLDMSFSHSGGAQKVTLHVMLGHGIIVHNVPGRNSHCID